MRVGAGGRERIQSFINELARAHGIDRARVRFIWDEQREFIVHSSHTLALKETFQVLTVYLENSWRILTFPESATEKMIQNPLLFRLAYREEIVEALRALKRRAKQHAKHIRTL